jgi:lipopolysaccharide transport system ATP-binding protein
LEIPGNFLSEGTYSVLGQIVTHDPKNIVHVFERDAVTFHAVESLSENQTRGKYSGHIPGVVRPLLLWNTNYKDK